MQIYIKPTNNDRVLLSSQGSNLSIYNLENVNSHYRNIYNVWNYQSSWTWINFFYLNYFNIFFNEIIT